MKFLRTLWCEIFHERRRLTITNERFDEATEEFIVDRVRAGLVDVYFDDETMARAPVVKWYVPTLREVVIVCERCGESWGFE